MKINSNYNYSYNHIKALFAKIFDKIATLQPALTAGDNITIADGVISATDTKYTAGDNVSISDQNVISATDTKYTAGTGISISDQNVISASGGKVYLHRVNMYDEDEDISIVIYLIKTVSTPINSFASMVANNSRILLFNNVEINTAQAVVTRWSFLESSYHIYYVPFGSAVEMSVSQTDFPIATLTFYDDITEL